MYTVFEVQISGELDPAKSDAYSHAVQMTTQLGLCYLFLCYRLAWLQLRS
jgi:hypothetical protein